MADNSTARELYSLVSPFNYCEHISCLDTDDFMTVRRFKEHELSQIFVIDRSKCIIQGEVNNDHLFETFGYFSDESSKSVRMDIIERIESGKKVYENVGSELFERRHWNILEWAIAICSQFYYEDLLQTFLNIASNGKMLDKHTKGGNITVKLDTQSENAANTQTNTNSTHSVVQGGNTPNEDIREIRNDTNVPKNIADVIRVNPVSLKTNSIQCLLANTVNTAPPSLFGICLDYMSWHSQIKYRGSMILPQCMHTKTKMMELQQHAPQEGNMQASKSSQVTLYGNVTVDSHVKQYLLEQATTRKYSVVLHRLTSQQIMDWQIPARV